MPKLHTVYDIQHTPLLTWQVYLFFIVTWLALLVFRYTRKNADENMKKLRNVSLGIGIFAFLIFLVCLASAFRDHAWIQNIYDEKNYSTVEGRVQDFHPMPASGHDSERFRVGNLYFTMCDYDLSIKGYNNAASLGGAIRANLYVRIQYPTYGQIAILRLETE